VLSAEAVARHWSTGENWTHQTPPVWPEHTPTRDRSATFHTCVTHTLHITVSAVAQLTDFLIEKFNRSRHDSLVTGYWHSALRPHNASSAPSTTLATGHQCIDFKVATLVHRSRSGNSSSYLADDCRLVANARERRLRSTESRTGIITRTHSIFGDRPFAAAGPARAMEQFTATSQRCRLTVQSVPVVTRNFCLDSGATVQCELF